MLDSNIENRTIFDAIEEGQLSKEDDEKLTFEKRQEEAEQADRSFLEDNETENISEDDVAGLMGVEPYTS